MWIRRDLERAWAEPSGMPVLILKGMRQCGKSSLLQHLGGPSRRHVTLDDLRARQTANADPALFFLQHPDPVTIDEVQYAPPLFPEIKLRVDAARAAALTSETASGPPSFWLTGSNQILMSAHVRESLAGRAAQHTLHTLSVSELTRGLEGFLLPQAFIRGGWPELYTNAAVAPTRYLNDYVNTFLEKDVALSAGIEKLQSFGKALGLMAARTACPFNATELAAYCGVKSVTIQDWASVLERNFVLAMLRGFHSNLNNRLLKMPKLYFMDAGLAARLQGWSDPEPLLNSPQAGLLFETLVFAEIVKTRDHHSRDWELYYWRTKEGDEIDFLVLDRRGRCVALEAKLGIQSVEPVGLSLRRRPGLPDLRQIGVVTAGGKIQPLSPESIQVPLAKLADHLLESLD
jgi:uncharacterized protein